MRVVAGPEAVAAIGARGGMLFVWLVRCGCRVGTATWVECSTEPPRRALDYRGVEAEGFLLFLHPSIRRLPDELLIEVRGRYRPHLRAYWDGCTVGPA